MEHKYYLEYKDKIDMDYIHLSDYNKKKIKYKNTTLNELYYIIKENNLNDIKDYLSKTKYKIKFEERSRSIKNKSVNVVIMRLEIYNFGYCSYIVLDFDPYNSHC